MTTNGYKQPEIKTLTCDETQIVYALFKICEHKSAHMRHLTIFNSMRNKCLIYLHP